jgi:hypothetical protein
MEVVMSSAAIIRAAAGITIVILVATVIVILKPQLLTWLGAAELSNLSNFGQFISGVFAPVAFVWLAVAVLLQSRELELQRIELRDTREVFELQKEEMKRAADDAREQTRIMTENLQREADRQVYSEVDILLYSISLYIVANSTRSYFSIEGGGFYIVDARGIADTINKQNYDRVFVFFRNSLQTANDQVNSRGQVAFQASPGCREFFDHCYAALQKLIVDQKYTRNELATARIHGLQIPECVTLMGHLRKNLLGG